MHFFSKWGLIFKVFGVQKDSSAVDHISDTFHTSPTKHQQHNVRANNVNRLHFNYIHPYLYVYVYIYISYILYML